VNINLLTVLDDMGITSTSELAPIRLYLRRKDINEKFGPTILAVTDSRKRYCILLHVLQKQQMDNNTQFDALSTLKNI